MEDYTYQGDPGHIGKTCPYCLMTIKPGEDIIMCPVCEMPHHRECWEENGKCTTFGCSGVPVRTYSDRYPRPVRCPRCGFNTSSVINTCLRCGNTLQSRSPVGLDNQNVRSIPRDIRGWNWAALIFTPIWCLSHRMFFWSIVSVLALYSIFDHCWIYIAISVYLAINGNAIAWKSRKFRSTTHFSQVERVWNGYALGLVMIASTIGILLYIHGL